ncbi:threonylcarbamoyl-AMP synthase [Erysipelotrichaceae bacterium Oil+RF-744-GAM-WT-6]|jgi:L-threonylcarbamoyladenylate synthase|uniref:L-threonylcarbamoyladenylate synthase n=1 Tax=Stecheria intestinalis TaxID=2606630 RepID=A0A7X2NUK1_9FIRM|nr:L-threonylcarbamoyladenylate synthase [Stecheria intestinalis]MCI6745543.1 threonylcarbamoyl-AMP synthase [Anaerolactibacter massiliensis]MDY4682699.1 L-threonylcarbamoyladenylate synthase [Lachnospiraceae bacterium]MDD6367380.1 L-threonylcarbamoyladenylate synthase [Stecheria intestinalis]MDD7679586.1 L-threonylcarbamoyladenylate synthase [Stecheria intestinalis]MSS59566.1 threonylcarbamoyl-AMP synthase [Stecheria intestinalis]
MRRFREEETEELAEILNHDGVISVPTDTVFGVCARMDSEAAQEHLRDVKHRPLTKAFPIMCSDEAQIKTVAEVTPLGEKMIRAFMPGPVTLILKKKAEVPAYVNGNMETLAVRMATSEPVKKLIEAVGCPLFMTSANQSGQPVCTSLDEIEHACPDLDGMMEGEPHFGEASTIIDCTKEEPVILRQGPVTMEQIQRVLTA